ncbi:MAG: hypothetical protein O7F15_08910, partial [Gammaproteobacteria bacterium]|nr:hypothetical protein [Gammaproteobacteria bacterium]
DSMMVKLAGPRFSPAFVARVSRCRCDGLRGLEVDAVVVDTTSNRLEGAQPVTASISAAAAEDW